MNFSKNIFVKDTGDNQRLVYSQFDKVYKFKVPYDNYRSSTYTVYLSTNDPGSFFTGSLSSTNLYYIDLYSKVKSISASFPSFSGFKVSEFAEVLQNRNTNTLTVDLGALSGKATGPFTLIVSNPAGYTVFPKGSSRPLYIQSRNDAVTPTPTPTRTPHNTATPTITNTRTSTQTSTNNPSSTTTRTSTSTTTSTPTATPTYTSTATKTKNYTPTPTRTKSPSRTRTVTSGLTATTTQTSTPTVTATTTRTSTQTYTRTATNTKTRTSTPTLSITTSRTNTQTPTRSVSPTVTPSATETIGVTRTPTPTQTATQTPTQTPTVTRTRSNTPTKTSTQTPSLTKSPTQTPTITRTLTRTPSITKTSSITKTRTSSQTSTRTSSQTPTPTQTTTRASAQTCINNASTTNIEYVDSLGTNAYIFNGGDAESYASPYGLGDGTFNISIPSSHPITVYNYGKTGVISIVGGDSAGTKTGQDGNTYTYYYGDVEIDVSGDFGRISYECYYHGYMGGQNNLVYDGSCDLTPTPTPTNTPTQTSTPAIGTPTRTKTPSRTRSGTPAPASPTPTPSSHSNQLYVYYDFIPTPTPTTTKTPTQTSSQTRTQTPTASTVITYWEPDDLSNLCAWIDPSDTSSYTSAGGTLQSLTDKSGTYGSSFTIGGSGITTGNTTNSLNVFTFPNGNDYIQSTNFTQQVGGDITGNHWAIGVFRYDATNSTQDSLWSYETNQSPKRDYAMSSASSSNSWPGELDLDALSSGRISNTIGNSESWSTGITRYAYTIVAAIFNKTGDQISVRVNGANAFTPVNDYSNSLSQNQQLRLMRNRSSQELEGRMGEFFAVAAKPGTSGTDISDVESAEGYLAWKWGLVSSLPSGHPYKNSRPTV